jgi:hypothetical protein
VQYLKHCLNPKVIAAVLVVAAGIWVFAPGAFAAALPVLVLAICPLSMLAMVLLMRGSEQGANSSAAEPPQHALRSSGDADNSTTAALRAQVAELEARLAAASQSADPPNEAATRHVWDADR